RPGRGPQRRLVDEPGRVPQLAGRTLTVGLELAARHDDQPAGARLLVALQFTAAQTGRLGQGEGLEEHLSGTVGPGRRLLDFVAVEAVERVVGGRWVQLVRGVHRDERHRVVQVTGAMQVTRAGRLARVAAQNPGRTVDRAGRVGGVGRVADTYA